MVFLLRHKVCLDTPGKPRSITTRDFLLGNTKVCPRHIVNDHNTEISESLLYLHNSFKPQSWGQIYLQPHTVLPRAISGQTQVPATVLRCWNSSLLRLLKWSRNKQCPQAQLLWYELHLPPLRANPIPRYTDGGRRVPQTWLVSLFYATWLLEVSQTLVSSRQHAEWHRWVTQRKKRVKMISTANLTYETSASDHVHQMLSRAKYKQSASEVEAAIENHFFNLNFISHISLKA